MAQKDSKEKTIGGKVFRVRMLDPLEANDLFLDLIHIITPGVATGAAALAGADKGELAKLVEAGDSASPAVGRALEKGIADVVDRLSKEQVRRFIETLMPVTDIKVGELWPQLNAGHFNIAFRGNLTDMYAWLRFALEVQFGDFIEKAKSGISLALGRLKLMPKPSESQST